MATIIYGQTPRVKRDRETTTNPRHGARPAPSCLPIMRSRGFLANDVKSSSVVHRACLCTKVWANLRAS